MLIKDHCPNQGLYHHPSVFYVSHIYLSSSDKSWGSHYIRSSVCPSVNLSVIFLNSFLNHHVVSQQCSVRAVSQQFISTILSEHKILVLFNKKGNSEILFYNFWSKQTLVRHVNKAWEYSLWDVLKIQNSAYAWCETKHVVVKSSSHHKSTF